MAVVDARTWMEVLSPETCWRLLSTQGVGRIAYLLAGEPEVVPVNYCVDRRSIVFRADPGAKLAALARNERVAFEIDESEPDTQSGWSVLIKGTAELVTKAADLRQLQQLPLTPWALGRKDVWVRILPESVTGRAIHHGSHDD